MQGLDWRGGEIKRGGRQKQPEKRNMIELQKSTAILEGCWILPIWGCEACARLPEVREATVRMMPFCSKMWESEEDIGLEKQG